MTANEEFVRDTFVRFNAELFKSELPMPRIRLSRASSFLGKLQYKVQRRGFGRKPTYSDYALIFSTLYDLPQSEWEDVVIHEMIHYMLMLRGIEDSSAHGTHFKSTMNEINSRYGRHITISHKGRAVNPNKLHYVGICELGEEKNDKIGLIVCSKAMAPRLSALIPKAFKVSKIDWYVTRHPYFSRYPHLRSVKMYLVPRSEIIASGAIEVIK